MPVGGDMRRVVHWLAALTILGFALAPPVTAQQADDADALNAEVIRLYHEGKYFEATLVAERALAIARRRSAPTTPMSPPCSTTWPSCTRPRAATPRPSRSTSALSPSARRRSAPTTPMSPRRSTTWPRCTSPGPLRRGRAALQARLAIREKALGPDHPDVAQSLNNLAELYQAQGRYAEAEPLYKRALAIREKALGPDHPDVATVAQQPGRAVPSPGPLRRGRAALQARPRHRREGARPRPPRCRHALNNLAELYQAQGRYGEAEPLFKRALAIHEKALGPDHPDVATDAQQPGRAVPSPGPLRRGRAALSSAPSPSTRRRSAPTTPMSPRRSTTWPRCTSPGPLRRGRAALQARPRHPREGARPRPPRCRHVAQQPGRAVRAQGRYGEAEPLYKRALAICEKALGPDHPDVARRSTTWPRCISRKATGHGPRTTGGAARACIMRRAERGTAVVGKALTGKGKERSGAMELAILGARQGRLSPRGREGQR